MPRIQTKLFHGKSHSLRSISKISSKVPLILTIPTSRTSTRCSAPISAFAHAQKQPMRTGTRNTWLFLMLLTPDMNEKKTVSMAQSIFSVNLQSLSPGHVYQAPLDLPNIKTFLKATCGTVSKTSTKTFKLSQKSLLISFLQINKSRSERSTKIWPVKQMNQWML